MTGWRLFGIRRDEMVYELYIFTRAANMRFGNLWWPNSNLQGGAKPVLLDISLRTHLWMTRELQTPSEMFSFATTCTARSPHCDFGKYELKD